MKKKRVIIGLIFSVLFVSYILFNTPYWSDGEYKVIDHGGAEWIKTLYLENHGRVDYVSSIGSNDKYIIVKSINSDKNYLTAYWIIDKSKDNLFLNSDEIVEGPLNLNEFVTQKEKYNISQLEFEKNWE